MQVKPRQWDAPTIEKPEGLAFGGDPGLDILVFKGLHNYAYRIPEAVQELVPEARLTQITGRPKEMPKDHADYYKFDVIVLADYGDGLNVNAHRCLADFVEAGGRLIVLGGIGTLGQGSFKGSPLEPVLPVEIRTARDIYRAPKPLVLGNRERETYPGRPVLYYFHAVKPRADAKARMWAGNLPVLWERSVGKGKAVVFVGTALGESEGKDETPFWEWNRWPKTLGKFIVGKR